MADINTVIMKYYKRTKRKDGGLETRIDLRNAVKEAIDTSRSMASAARKLDMPFSSFRRAAIQFGYYSPNQFLPGIRKGGTVPIPLSEILEGKHPYHKTGHVKRKLLAAGLIESKCEECGVTDIYNGKPIVLELDHIDGNSRNHRRENLKMLCPNCHSQTPTFRNRKRA